MEKTGQQIINENYKEIEEALGNLLYATIKKDTALATTRIACSVDLISKGLEHLRPLLTEEE
jgi:hypothetical protein